MAKNKKQYQKDFYFDEYDEKDSLCQKLDAISEEIYQSENNSEAQKEFTKDYKPEDDAEINNFYKEIYSDIEEILFQEELYRTQISEQISNTHKGSFIKEIANKENLNTYYIVRPDDFIYNPRISVSAPVGPINRNKLSINGVMSPLYTVFRTHDIIPEYLEYFFKSTGWHLYMKFYGDSGARADRFSIKDSVFM